MKVYVKRFVQVITLVLIITGCSSSEVDLGLYTTSVIGKIGFNPDVDTKEAFVLVMNHHRTLMETSEGYLMRVSASIERPDEEGKYQVEFDADTAMVDLMVYAEGTIVESVRYKRTLGIKRYQHDFQLQKDKNWKNSYYIMIKPVLTGYIVEERYLMDVPDKHYLDEWLVKTEDNL